VDPKLLFFVKSQTQRKNSRGKTKDTGKALQKVKKGGSVGEAGKTQFSVRGVNDRKVGQYAYGGGKRKARKLPPQAGREQNQRKEDGRAPDKQISRAREKTIRYTANRGRKEETI